MQASGGTAPYTWSVSSGRLPSGLTLDPASGKIAGTPGVSGTSTFSVTVTDHGNLVQNITKTFLMSTIARLAITTSVLATPVRGFAYTAALQDTGGVAPYTWSISSGSLPAGLSLNPATGVISGTPTGTDPSNFVTTVTDSGNPQQSAAQAWALSLINQLSVPSTALSAGTSGIAYAAKMQVLGGVPAYTWSLVSGTLPNGLTMAGTTGVISGTPTVPGTFSFAARVVDNGSPTQAITLRTSIKINAAPAAIPATISVGTTWYVRPDGGTRYSSKMPLGQCDGKADAPYSGLGTNQHCAFKDVRYFWQDGSYTTDNTQASFPAYGWIGSGGDTYLIRGSIGTGVSYRVGWNNRNSSYDAPTFQFWGVQGNPYGSGAPVPLAGTATQHTRILGENYANCSAQSARTQLHGGWAVTDVLLMAGASYVDLGCLDITDYSNCGKANQVSDCNANGVMQDYAVNGIEWSNASTNNTMTNVRVHGMAGAGMVGPTGNGNVFTYLDILGNASSGWNADSGDGTTGSGSLLVQNFSIIGNGCAEEYPVVDAMPYSDCTDQNGGGYGDGFGTATSVSKPGWAARFDQGVVAYNTQDGLDSLHLIGSGSSMTITRVLAYGNMGQQIKVGGSSGTAVNNLIVGNCNAMRQRIPGFPSGYNAHLSLFCRASNNAVFISVGKNSSTRFAFNTLINAGAIGVGIACDQFNGACDRTSLVDYRNNIQIGYADSPANGDPSGDGDNPTPIYQCITDGDCSPQQSLNYNVFTNPGSYFANNVSYGSRNGQQCPATAESNAICGAPGLVDPSWHLYGYGNMAPLTGNTTVRGAGVAIPGITVDYNGATRLVTPSIGAIE